MSIPIFIINLASSIDRKKYMQILCIEHGLYPTFIDAVDGKLLSNSETSSIYDKQKAIKSIGRELMLGEIGCALSHKKVYQKMIDENIEVALVLEDDVSFDLGMNNFLSKIHRFPSRWDLILLGHNAGFINSQENKSPISYWGRKKVDEYVIGRLAGFGFGTYGYIINIKGAKKMLTQLDQIYCPIDLLTSNDEIINVFALHNTIVKAQADFNSLISIRNFRKTNNFKYLKPIFSKLGILKVTQKINTIRKKLKPIKRYH